MLPQMAKTQKSDKTYSADESSLRGKKRQLKIKLKGKKTKWKKTTHGSSELIKSQNFHSMGLSLINPSIIKPHSNDTISQRTNIFVAATEEKKKIIYTLKFFSGEWLACRLKGKWVLVLLLALSGQGVWSPGMTCSCLAGKQRNKQACLWLKGRDR